MRFWAKTRFHELSARKVVYAFICIYIAKLKQLLKKRWFFLISRALDRGRVACAGNPSTVHRQPVHGLAGRVACKRAWGRGRVACAGNPSTVNGPTSQKTIGFCVLFGASQRSCRDAPREAPGLRPFFLGGSGPSSNRT